jgi:hypothetical protein
MSEGSLTINMIIKIRFKQVHCKIKLVTEKTEWKPTIKSPDPLYLITTMIKII